MVLLRLFLAPFAAGGPIMWAILGVSVVVWYVGFGRVQMLGHIAGARMRFLRAWGAADHASATGCKAYDVLLHTLGPGEGKIELDYALLEFRAAVLPALDQGYATMNAWISAAPLLGLLGTVAGMVRTFRVITDFGADNPALLAEGISMALLTTQAGLAAAFPAMLLHNHLLNRKNHLRAAIDSDEVRLRESICSSSGG